jgi:hypothetical protein
MPRNNDRALAAFLAKKTEVDALLKQLQEKSDDHFNVAPEDVHYGHVGDITRIAQMLKGALGQDE